MDKLEFLEKIKNVEISYDLEYTYNELYNLWMDYLYDTNDYSMEYIFNDYCS